MPLVSATHMCSIVNFVVPGLHLDHRLVDHQLVRLEHRQLVTMRRGEHLPH